MGETDADWQLLADERQDIHARLEVAARILRTDDPRIDVLCTIFVDVSVATGNIRRAFDQAIAAAVANLRVPEVPNTGGPNARGVSGQDWEPYELRNLNAPVFAALARRSFERPLLAHWLFEATKLYAAERIEAIDALEQANTEPSLAAGIASVVALADAPIQVATCYAIWRLLG